MARHNRTTSAFALALAAALVLGSCESFGELGGLGASIAASTGAISGDQASAITAAAEATGKAFETLTLEQQYYLGRSVAANLIADYRPWDDPAANAYVNAVGQALAVASNAPYTFKGYRFLILDSDEINAFAAPGGFIMVTKGMLRCTETEDELAAVLAHEIGHVELEHGVKAIKASRWTDAVTKTALAGAAMSDADVAEVTATFGDSIGDITQTLVVNGYSRKQERDADEAAVAILSAVGYDPGALIRMLEEMDRRLKPGGTDFAKTHPSPQARIDSIRALVEARPVPTDDGQAARQARYDRALARI